MTNLSASGQPPPPSVPPFPPDQIRDSVSHAVHSSLVRLCGGGVIGQTDTTSSAATSSTEWHQALYELAVKSVSFTNGGDAIDNESDSEYTVHLTGFVEPLPYAPNDQDLSEDVTVGEDEEECDSGECPR